MSKQEIIIIFGLLIISTFTFSPEIFSQEQISALLESAYQEEKDKNLENAIKIFDEILEIDPDNVDALVGKGGILINQWKNFESLEYLENAIKIDPDNSPARTNIAVALARLNHTDAAELHLDHILKNDGNDINALNNKAILEILYKNNATAGMQLINKVLEIDPDNVDAFNNKKSLFGGMPQTEFDGLIQTVLRDKHGSLIGYAESNRILISEWVPQKMFQAYAQKNSQQVVREGDEFTIVYVYKQSTIKEGADVFRSGTGLTYDEKIKNEIISLETINGRQHGMLQIPGDEVINMFHLIFPDSMLFE